MHDCACVVAESACGNDAAHVVHEFGSWLSNANAPDAIRSAILAHAARSSSSSRSCAIAAITP